MIVAGLIRLESTIRRRSCPSDQRLPVPARSGARLPWKRSSGNGPLWQSRHRPSWRLVTMARPRGGSPLAPVSEAGIESCAFAPPPLAAPAAAIGDAGDLRDAAGLLRRDDVGHLRLVLPEIGHQRARRGVDRGDVAA